MNAISTSLLQDSSADDCRLRHRCCCCQQADSWQLVVAERLASNFSVSLRCPWSTPLPYFDDFALLLSASVVSLRIRRRISPASSIPTHLYPQHSCRDPEGDSVSVVNIVTPGATDPGRETVLLLFSIVSVSSAPVLILAVLPFQAMRAHRYFVTKDLASALRPIILFSVLSKVVAECGEKQVFEESVQNCCSVCPAGYGVALPCTESNDTICTKCAPHHYSALPSHKDSCEACSLCPKNAHVVHVCNTTHNTKCECDKGYFKDADRNLCRPCTACGHGEGAVRQCDSYHDTLCKPCPPQFFSNVYSGVAGCQPCSKCKPNESLRKLCSPIEDTVCEGYVSARNLSGAGHLSADMDDSSQKNIIPIYCALLGAVIVVLILYVVVKRFQLCPCGAKTHPPKTLAALKPVHAGSNAALKSTNRKYPSLSGSSELKQPILVTNETLVKDLPERLRREIEKRLVQTHDEKKNWVALAQHFEYTQAKIRGFESQSSPSRPGSASSHQAATAVRHFLSDWCLRSGDSRATVQSLIDALQAIQRDDIAQFLVRESSSGSRWTPIDIV